MHKSVSNPFLHSIEPVPGYSLHVHPKRYPSGTSRAGAAHQPGGGGGLRVQSQGLNVPSAWQTFLLS
jgi:hypothetical protein